MDSIPSLLGLAFRAGRLAVGEEPVGTLCRAHKAYLLLLAADAAENTVRRAHRFCETAPNTILVSLPHSKAELGSCLGRSSCAMMAVGDVGFAAAVADKLAKADPDTYSAVRDQLSQKADRTKKRRNEKRAQEKSPRPGKRSPARKEKKPKT